MSLAQVFGIIGQVLVDLDDSHTFFLPPGRSSQTEYGWQMQMIGDKCVDADIIMTDGKSLEHFGVVPDELRLPTTQDMAAKRDPVLAYAVSLLGGKITPAEAGALFPLEWRK